jgi:hypothetical protein
VALLRDVIAVLAIAEEERINAAGTRRASCYCEMRNALGRRILYQSTTEDGEELNAHGTQHNERVRPSETTDTHDTTR